MIDDPGERVFHVDTECYVIYLGKEPDDYRPFLRIGNSPKFPEKAKNFISAVVVADTFTGNQLIEHENLQLPLNGETRYVGDPAEVNRLKQFLEEKDLPVAEYVYEETEDSPNKGGAYVYFYRSGNLHIVRDGRELFDLRDRERTDSHFVSRAEKAVQLVKANPLRYFPQDLVSPGFVLAGDRLYLFSEGKLGVRSVTSEYITSLGKYGIDPDLLTWMEEDGPTEALLSRMKRASLTRKDLKVLLPDASKLRSAASIFPESKLHCDIVQAAPGEAAEVAGFGLKRTGTSFVCSFPEKLGGLAASIETGKSQRDAANALFAGLNLAVRGSKPIAGVPYRFSSEARPAPEDFVRTYLEDPLDALKDLLDPRAREALKSLSSLARTVFAPAGSSSAALLAEARSKTLGFPEEPELFPVCWNARELAKLYGDWKEIDPSAKKQASRFAALCPSILSPESNESRIPLIGDFFRIQDSWYLLYRYNSLVTPLKLRQAKKSAEGIEKLTVLPGRGLP